MNKKLEHQRLHALFADLEQLDANPLAKDSAIQRELESLRARLLELEKNFLESEDSPSVVESAPVENPREDQERSGSRTLFEKDQVGFAFANDRLESLHEAKNSLPTINDAIHSPLIIRGQVAGGIQVAPPSERQPTANELSLAHAIAHQASLQIESLRLLAEAERSRAEAENATRQFMHEGWESYLDAIHQKERVGFAYDQASVTPYYDKLHANGGVQETVTVMEEQIGKIYLKPNPSRPLTNSDQGLVSGVAAQVAQQVENIRLLADAARARAEAEDAIRRLTRTNWMEFTAEKDSSQLGFIYNSLDVTPVQEQALPEDIVLSQPLMVRGETIGQLAVAGWKDVSPQARELASAIAAQTSIHLETLRLTEELQKRARELQELDRLKSAFLANMSHELRTPLNSILGFTDVMLEGLDGPLTDYMNNDLRLIQKNGQHLLHLINDVLDMAKIESGRMNLHLEKFVVHGLLDEVTSITSTLASEKNTALFIEDDSDRETEIYADNTRIRQVMINLVNNAIKFTTNGKISMHVSNLDGTRILIRVRDTGLGIPPDHLESIFQEFTQVDTSTTRKVGGTGLGLPISRRLVEMHGGRLWAESTGVEGAGSTFFVELPLEARITDVVEKQEK